MLHVLKHNSWDFVDNCNLAILTGDKIGIIPCESRVTDRVIGMPRNLEVTAFYSIRSNARNRPQLFNPLWLCVRDRALIVGKKFSMIVTSPKEHTGLRSIIGYGWIQRTVPWNRVKDAWVFDAHEIPFVSPICDFYKLELSLCEFSNW